MSDYPIPSYAASIWVTGDTLWLGFPPLANGVQAHSVSVPFTEKGLALVLRLLRERQQGQVHIGLNGAPTKWQVEQELKCNTFLRAMRPVDPLEAAVDNAVRDFFK